jgi:lysozyme
MAISNLLKLFGNKPNIAQPAIGNPKEIALSKLTNQGFISENEGFRQNIYKDTMGRNTIGSGFNIDDETVRKLIPRDVLSGKRPITTDENNAILSKLTKRAENDAQTFVGKDTFNKLSREQKLGLTDMAFNLGLTKLNKFDELRKALVLGDNERAGIEVLDSEYAKQVPGRARANANLMLNRR